VTVWVLGLAWVFTSVVSPAVSASAVVPAAGPVVHHKTARLCSTVVNAGQAACYAIRQTDTVQPPGVSANAVSPNATPAGYGPSTLVAAYKLDPSKGSGQTVAVVDAYDGPNAESDLAVYRAQFGLPPCTTANGCFKKVNQSGSTTNLPPPNSGWAGEISLDLDMVSATCPNCHILLVEATSPTFTNLGTAVNRAVTLGAKFVSNSYGGSEFSSESSYDSAYYHHAGVVITASSGDANYGAQYPAAGAYVTAVGGTSLTSANNTRGWTESVWKTSSTEGTGSGCSTYIAKPSFQASVTTDCSNRAEADVSAVADPNTGVTVYNTYQAPGWQVYGGTSASAPIIASVYALAGAPGASDSPNAYPYSHTSSLYDVTSGNNGTCSPGVLCTAGTGWDGPTGLGTPNGSAAFTGANIISVTNPGSQTSTAGSPLSLQIQASDTGSGSTLSYASTGLPPGLVINSGTGLISGTPNTAGSYTVTATATDGTSANGSATFTWVIQALVTAPGAPTGVTATAGDASAVVSWTAPASDGGSAITGYTIASSPACPTCSGMTTTGVSSTVSGLTNGTSYTFDVVARNALGPGPASAMSDPVVPLPACTDQWVAEYYTGTSLSGSPAGVRCDAQINNTWGSGGPTGVGVGTDNFSVRWSQTLSVPAAGPYVVSTTSDDGIRVSVDGSWVIDNWTDHGPTTNTASVTLSAGGPHGGGGVLRARRGGHGDRQPDTAGDVVPVGAVAGAVLHRHVVVGFAGGGAL